MTDLSQTIDIPALDPRNWKPRYVPGRWSETSVAAASPEPVCVGIDILDEDHSLRLSIRRLATDARLRAVLGARARRLWAERFPLDRMVERYRDAIATACATPPADLASRRASLPDHLLTDGTEHATGLLRETGLPESRLADLWLPPTSEPG
jgi:hypothetical protein